MTEESISTESTLMPTLNNIKVPASKLIIDPNNPRFLTHDNDYTNESDFLDPGVSVETNRKMTDADEGDYRIDGLKKSIRENGWVPVQILSSVTFPFIFGFNGSSVVGLCGPFWKKI